MTVHAGKDAGKGEHLFIGGGSVNWYSLYGNEYAGSLGSWELM